MSPLPPSHPFFPPAPAFFLLARWCGGSAVAETARADSVRKTSPDAFTLLVASAEPRASVKHEIKILDRHATLSVEYGDFVEAMQKAVAALTEASYNLALLCNAH